jgi:serine phosphatase RsbU (regulator of sigma subunit)
VPEWIGCDGYTGLLEYRDKQRQVQGRAPLRLMVRGLAWPRDGTDVAAIVDIPIGDDVTRQLLRDTSVELMTVGEPTAATIDTTLSSEAQEGNLFRRRFSWTAFLEWRDWNTGAAQDPLSVGIRSSIAELYSRIMPTERFQQVDQLTFGQILLLMVAVVGVLFLVIQLVAFAMGLGLARSITGAVHELFEGTERVRRGDFSGEIAVRSRDQMGQLAESFNEMTASIEDLLREKAEKERLEQELLIARRIQMSLLPQGALSMPGLSLTAHCEPAREVGGDYYDFLPVDEFTIGILIADVSGKGTSAALYMAELKGIVLSLSQRHSSPRELLIEADRIISRHLDSRSFITISYLLVDLRARTVRYARAGHCPMIYMPGPYARPRQPQLLTPDGLVLGLQLDEGRTFTRLLEEVTLPLGTGDLFVLYTDGMSEAMNAHGDCFGDARLADVVGSHADLPADELRERILRDLEAFAGSAAQHDDMTMVLLRVDEMPVV